MGGGFIPYRHFASQSRPLTDAPYIYIHREHDDGRTRRERAITANTVMLYASAPTFGQGVIDPVAAIGALGRKYDVGACNARLGIRTAGSSKRV